MNPADCDMCGTANPDIKASHLNSNTTREVVLDSDSDDVVVENWRCSRCGALTSASNSNCGRCMQRRNLSVSASSEPHRTTLVSNSARSAFAGAALGAVVGAGASLLQSGSLVEGALRGATWGAVGGLMANSGDVMAESSRSESFRRPNRRRGASSASSAVQPSQQRQRRGDAAAAASSSSSSWAAAEIGFPMTTVSGVDFDRPARRRGRGARGVGTRPGGLEEDEFDDMLHRHIASLLFSSFMIGNPNSGIDIDSMSYDELYER
jgi:ribosomal protein L40E